MALVCTGTMRERVRETSTTTRGCDHGAREVREAREARETGKMGTTVRRERDILTRVQPHEDTHARLGLAALLGQEARVVMGRREGVGRALLGRVVLLGHGARGCVRLGCAKQQPRRRSAASHPSAAMSIPSRLRCPPSSRRRLATQARTSQRHDGARRAQGGGHHDAARETGDIGTKMQRGEGRSNGAKTA
ncbi:hypothetical protein DENSPDRAFT_855487 [Dentipellis sp. KUC8613]|nr:hypothetical protein DENSPDRAFT_855487 [Dentipellis sp. KUC8613]